MKSEKLQRFKGSKVIAIIFMAALVLPSGAYSLGPQNVFAENLLGTPYINDGKSLRKGEQRATLDPALFKDPFVKSAYRVARQIPWVLDSIYCYCHCEEQPFNHKSLLSCYVDTHASV